MPIDVACPSCQKQYRVPDKFAGQAAKCKACGSAMQVPARPAQTTASADEAPSGLTTLFDEEFGDPDQADGSRRKRCPACGAKIQDNTVLCVDCGYDVKKRRRRELKTDPSLDEARGNAASAAREPIPVEARKSLQIVGLGLGVSLCAMVVVYVSFAIAFAVIAGMLNEMSHDMGQQWTTISVVGVLLVGMLTLTGHVLCAWVPRQSDARGIIYTVLGLELVFLASPIWATLLDRQFQQLQHSFFISMAIFAVVVLLPVIASISFITFLRALARYLGRSDLQALANSVLKLLVAPIAAIASVWLLVAIAALLRAKVAFIAIGLGIVGLLILVIACVRLVWALYQYVKLLIALRRVCARPPMRK